MDPSPPPLNNSSLRYWFCWHTAESIDHQIHHAYRNELEIVVCIEGAFRKKRFWRKNAFTPVKNAFNVSIITFWPLTVIYTGAWTPIFDVSHSQYMDTDYDFHGEVRVMKTKLEKGILLKRNFRHGPFFGKLLNFSSQNVVHSLRTLRTLCRLFSYSLCTQQGKGGGELTAFLGSFLYRPGPHVNPRGWLFLFLLLSSFFLLRAAEKRRKSRVVGYLRCWRELEPISASVYRGPVYSAPRIPLLNK